MERPQKSNPGINGKEVNPSTVSPTSAPQTGDCAHGSDITRLLTAVHNGETSASERLMKVVYQELHSLAQGYMTRENPGQTLQATALIHEAWLRLGGEEQPAWENRAHFFASAAEAMRRILVDSARRKARMRRGGSRERVPLTSLDLADNTVPDHVLAVNEAMELLREHDPVGAELIKLRFFGGLDYIAAAKAMGLSERSAKRAWAYARAWLLNQLKSGTLL